MSLKVERSNPEGLIKLGLVHFSRYEFSDAFACFDRLTKLFPDFAPGWNNKGFVLMKLGEMRWALDSFERAVDLDPSYELALVNLKRARKLMTAVPRNRATRDVSIKMTMLEEAYKKGMAAYSKRRYRAAVTAFDKILAINPTDEEALNNKGMALAHLGKLKQAIECFQDALDVNADYEVARTNLERYAALPDA